MRIINRALYKEILAVFLAVVLVLLLVILTTQLAKYLAWAAAGKISASVVFTILGLKFPAYLIMLVPLGMFLSVLLVLGRMGQDRELVVLLASGIGFDDIYKMVLKLALVLGLILAVLSFFVSPLAERKSDALQQSSSELGVLEGIVAGKFKELPGGNRVIYAEKIDNKTGLMHNVFVQIQTKNTSHTLKADRGEVKIDEGFSILILYDGTRNTKSNKTPGNTDYSVVEYATHGIVLRKAGVKNVVGNVAGMSTMKLLQNLKKPNAQAEIQWRLSIPFMGIMLMMLGVAFSGYTPRSGKYRMLLPGVIIYFSYIALLKAFKSELASGNIPGFVGLWGVHLLMLVIIAFAIWRTLKPLSTR